MLVSLLPLPYEAKKIGECYCGDSISVATVDYQKCYMPCKGKSTELCGGVYSN